MTATTTQRVLMYHVSPTRNRASIETNGLRPCPDAGANLVWLFSSRADAEPYLAKSWGGSLGRNDLWEVDVTHLGFEPDPGDEGFVDLVTWVVHGRIRSDPLTRVEPEPTTDPVPLDAALRELVTTWRTSTQDGQGVVREHWRGPDFVEGQDTGLERCAEELQALLDRP